MIVFGPVPSRRLGRSLGINNIPAKHCSYSCLYCQVGPTHVTETIPRQFYQPQSVFDEVRTRVQQVLEQGESVDYLTFVPDGEPTLDDNLAETIGLLRDLDIKIAIISNTSLVWNKQVRQTLRLADWVSLKVDSVDEPTWRKLNRPHQQLNLQEILSGMLVFADEFDGFLATETMMLDGINTDDANIASLGKFLQRLEPDKAYLAIPTRPMAEPEAGIPGAEKLNHIYQILSQRVSDVELLTGYEGNAFSSTGNFIEDILAISAVHPLRREQVQTLLDKTKTDWGVVQNLVRQNQLRQVEHNGITFYLRAYAIKSEDL